MAVLPMRRIRVFGLRRDRKAILEYLQRRGVVEVTDSKADGDMFVKTDMSTLRSTFDKTVVTLTKAVEIINTMVPEQGGLLSSLNGRKELSLKDYDTFSAEREEVSRVAAKLLSLDKTRTDNKAEILRLKAQIESLTPWLPLDIPMKKSGTKKAVCVLGFLSGEHTEEELVSRLAEQIPAIPLTLEIISADKQQTCVAVICLRTDKEDVQSGLNTLGFTRPAVLFAQTPQKAKEELEKQVKTCTAAIETAEKEIALYAGTRNAIKFMADYYTMRSEKYEILGRIAQSKRTFLLEGYIPARDAGAVESAIGDRYDAAVEITEPDEQEDVPVLLNNKAFYAPVESVVESYSLPGKGEIDPTSVMALFYYVLFGMMLSDAAYGLIIVAGCAWALWKFKSMEQGMKQTLTMFLYCGISTAVWGFVFGSFFGDAVTVIGKTFFNVDIGIPPLWFAPLDNPMKMLMFAFLVGILHIFVGLGLKFYTLVKQHKYADAIYDAVFWYMLVGGGIIYLLTTQMFVDMAGLPFILPPVVGTIAAVSAGIGAVGIILTSGRDSRNPFKRFLKGLYGLYNVTGYLSDILSYSRLLALGLATGVIANVFNKMGSMLGGGVVGAILFIVVFVVGHTMNIGINLLGAYVHTNRLQYVEFFGKFYEGGGRKFMPFGMHTKYYKVREEDPS